MDLDLNPPRFRQFICPLCRAPLAIGANAWTCANAHSFDVAREGYVNLLPVQHKHSRAPGDNAAMVTARREFLQAGHYLPLRDAAVAMLAPLHAQTLLDLGCGEGWYSGAFQTIVRSVMGLDIAKPAVRLAAKRFPAITWLVGSSALLPLADASLDVVCSLFSPLAVAEMQRVLKPGGHVLLATPAPEHLWTIRAQLFEQVRPHQPDKFLAGFDAGFDLRQRQSLRFALHLSQLHLRQLLLMTPYAWRATPQRRAVLEARERFDTEASFTLLLFRRKT